MAEFTNLDKILPVFKVAIDSYTMGYKTKKGEMLTPQDVTYTITRMREVLEMEEEESEEENNEESKEEENSEGDNKQEGDKRGEATMEDGV